MKYIVVPISEMEVIPQETLEEFHLSPRFNIDKTKALLKLENYDLLFPPAQPLVQDGEIIENVYPYQVYDYGTKDFTDLLSSLEWTPEETVV